MKPLDLTAWDVRLAMSAAKRGNTVMREMDDLDAIARRHGMRVELHQLPCKPLVLVVQTVGEQHKREPRAMTCIVNESHGVDRVAALRVAAITIRNRLIERKAKA